MMNRPYKKGTELVHPQIRELNAYRVQPNDCEIKLDAMESPYGISESLLELWHQQLERVDVNRYPDASAKALKKGLRGVFEIPDNFDVTLGNGSDELLQLIQLAVGGHGRCIMAPQPSFVMYEIIARYTRGNFIGVDLDEHFQLPEDEWLSSVESSRPDCVFFSYPNNPTGNLFPPDVIEETARLTDGLVVVDEAYHAYSSESMMSAMNNHENLVIVRTLSKSGLAGLRVGYLVSHPSWGHEFEKLRLPYNIGSLHQETAVFALNHWDEIQMSEHIITERSRVSSVLKKDDRIKVYPSDTNFITVRVKQGRASELFEALKSDGILIKILDGAHRILSNCLRITIGTMAENDLMCNSLIRNLK